MFPLFYFSVFSHKLSPVSHSQFASLSQSSCLPSPCSGLHLSAIFTALTSSTSLLLLPFSAAYIISPLNTSASPFLLFISITSLTFLHILCSIVLTFHFPPMLFLVSCFSFSSQCRIFSPFRFCPFYFIYFLPSTLYSTFCIFSPPVQSPRAFCFPYVLFCPFLLLLRFNPLVSHHPSFTAFFQPSSIVFFLFITLSACLFFITYIFACFLLPFYFLCAFPLHSAPPSFPCLSSHKAHLALLVFSSSVYTTTFFLNFLFIKKQI